MKQGNKIRPIDNFSEFYVNAAFGSETKVGMIGIDHVVSWSRAWLEAVKDDGSVDILDNLGGRWRGILHSSWTIEEWRKLVGRVTDLENAYKQIAVSPKARAFSIIAALDPGSGKVQLFRALSLMFGETAAVYAFLRISRALAAISARLFKLLTVEFFDDFTQIENEALGQSAWETMEGRDINFID